ncbi:Uncharacterised protein [Mycobacteroides abscessus]|nr:Uncharacterised protein [Mycobacteroides abscessus]
MCGGIVGLGNSVGALGEYSAVLDDDGGKGSTALLDVTSCEVDGSLCEVHGIPYVGLEDW